MDTIEVSRTGTDPASRGFGRSEEHSKKL